MQLNKLFTKEVKIGISGVVALFLLIYGINYLSGANIFQPSSYYYVKYSNINGLTKSSPVFADGYKVGIVRNIIYDYAQPNNVVVQVEVDTDLRVPKGSTAELQTEMLGTVKMILLLANNPRERYQVGDTIPGVSSSGLMGSVQTIMPKLEQLLPKMDSILTSLNRILADENIPATLQSLRRTTDYLATSSQQLNVLMRNDIPQITGKLITLEDNFIAISENLKGIDLAGTMQQVERTLANVHQFTEQLKNPNSSLGLLMNDSQLYHNLNSTASNASALLEDLKSHPKRYVHFSLFGRKQ